MKILNNVLILYDNYGTCFFYTIMRVLLCYYVERQKMRKFCNFIILLRTVILDAPTTIISVSISFCHSYYIWLYSAYNYVSALSLSFIHESGTVPSTDANPDNLGDYAVFLGRDSTQNRCNADFSLLPLSQSFQHFPIASYPGL